MIRRPHTPIPLIVPAALSMLVALVAPARGQDSPHMERSLGGTLINQDYFTASQYPEVKATLWIVEYGHLNEEDIRHFNAREYSVILFDVHYALDKFPNHPRALHMLSTISKYQQDFSAPIPFFEKALKLYPQHAYTHAQYGKYLTEIGAMSAGVQELEEALRLGPGLIVAQAWLLGAKRKLEESAPARPSRPARAGAGGDARAGSPAPRP